MSIEFRIFGIDQSLSCTAVTMQNINYDRSVHSHEYFFTTDIAKKTKESTHTDIMPMLIKKSTHFRKVREIGYAVEQIFAHHAKEGDILALEGYSYGSIGNTFQLGELGGLIKWLGSQRGMKIRVYEPTVVKKYATGKGAGKKEPMFRAYEKLYPHSPIIRSYAENLNRRIPLEPQLKSTLGTPLCDLIDSHFISDMALVEHLLRCNNYSIPAKPEQLELFATKPKGKNKKSILETPYD